jgi:hypothetical protein
MESLFCVAALTVYQRFPNKNPEGSHVTNGILEMAQHEMRANALRSEGAESLTILIP